MIAFEKLIIFIPLIEHLLNAKGLLKVCNQKICFIILPSELTLTGLMTATPAKTIFKKQLQIALCSGSKSSWLIRSLLEKNLRRNERQNLLENIVWFVFSEYRE